jgi:hypothetical protein
MQTILHHIGDPGPLPVNHRVALTDCADCFAPLRAEEGAWKSSKNACPRSANPRPWDKGAQDA